jgi:hypothetical protein
MLERGEATLDWSVFTTASTLESTSRWTGPAATKPTRPRKKRANRDTAFVNCMMKRCGRWWDAGEGVRWWSWLVKKASHPGRAFYTCPRYDVEGACKNSPVEQRRPGGVFTSGRSASAQRRRGEWSVATPPNAGHMHGAREQCRQPAAFAASSVMTLSSHVTSACKPRSTTTGNAEKRRQPQRSAFILEFVDNQGPACKRQLRYESFSVLYVRRGRGVGPGCSEPLRRANHRYLHGERQYTPPQGGDGEGACKNSAVAR